jgi:hypothetical protein
MEVSMRALAAAFGLGLLVVASAPGCVIKAEDDASRFRQAIPASSDVKLAIPKDGATSGTKSFSTKGGDAPAPYAKYYRFTRDMADSVDWGTAEILGLVWIIVHSPPTHVDAKHAVWGPGSGNALDPVVWRMTVTEVGPDEYEYVLAGRPKASTSEADFRAVITGHGWGEKHPLHRKGNFAWDNDAYRALDPARAKDDGNVKVDFDLRTYPATIVAEAHTVADAKGWFKVGVTHEKNGGGAVDVSALGDTDDSKLTKLENVVLHSRWNETGAGRADAQITGGDAPSTIDASECWSSSFYRVYYKDTLSFEPASGLESSCVYPAATF